MKKSIQKQAGRGLAFVLLLCAFTACKKSSDNLQELSALSGLGTSSKLMATAAATAATAAGEVTGSGGNFTATVNGVNKYTGTNYISAIQAAINGLTAGRTAKEWVTIKISGASGSSGGSLKYVNMASNTGLDFAGNTFNANSGDALIIPIWADRKSNIEVKNLKVNRETTLWNLV